MTVSTQQKKRAQRQWLRRRQTSQSYQANQSKAWPSWLTKAEREKYLTLCQHKTLEYICRKDRLLVAADWDTIEKSLLELLLQQRHLQHKQLPIQNRLQQQKLKALTSGRLSKTHASAGHKARHERKRYRHQPR